MSTVATTIEGRMLCASVLTYSIPFVYPPTGPTPQTEPYYSGVGYSTPPVMIGSDANNSNAACTVGINQDGIVLAFRGTVYNSIMDWVNDLLVKPVAVTGIQGKVHDGFNNAVNAILAPIVMQIKSLLKANPSAKLYITGHSKGAGMAPIAAYYLSNLGIYATSVYLFAPPLSGTSDYATAYNKLFPDTFLYENYLDIVPLLPPAPTTAGTLDFYFLKLGTIEGVAAAVAITAIGLLGYSAVGTLNTTFYIPNPINGVYTLVPMTNTLASQQLQDICTALIAGDFSLFANAHNSRCGYGYMSAIAPNVCN
ncbi:MAG: lipase family protein [Flavobacteriales bacterium]|nr:lipase family protein [Flavobacteriales bacterium]